MAQNGYNSIKIATLSKKLSDNFIQASATIEELSASAHEIATNQENLNNDIMTINTLTDNINEILVSIKNIASQVKMLGLNASIEASRAGESGKGFAVVASEIRKLSESSRQTADLISDITIKIHTSVDGTINNATTTLSTSQQQSTAMEELNASIQEAVKVAEHLNKMLNRN
ncbi:methyl-accepting chemotaxis protein [Inconstantimicrobium porci]|uniref:methyl-accepting chemotaxis protein n=1 Tax=Inconstantimicrobium porci TaxID=2652291 RepID=UPI00240A346E|nr:methyl-accepting chemotaxis protein [Inconstantimicrobium porci]MDD6770165.1 methyl-accepting chemotaxis protein [Inconstantimicrobium porci]